MTQSNPKSQIPNSKSQIPNPKFPTPNSQLPIPNSQFPTPNSQPPIPNSPKLIFLVGMPCCRENILGDQIAKAYPLEFIDLDVFVALQEKASVPALFAQYGENGFREREHKHLKKLIGNITTNTIIACGGGTPCFHENMQVMKDAGIVIYLQADLPHLLGNINNSKEIRPLLKGRADVGAYLENLLQKRKRFYEQAHHILQTKDISIVTFDEIISSCINRIDSWGALCSAGCDLRALSGHMR